MKNNLEHEKLIYTGGAFHTHLTSDIQCNDQKSSVTPSKASKKRYPNESRYVFG